MLGLRGLFDPLKDLLAGGFPVFGTCAGLILLAHTAVGRDQKLLGVLDVDVERNAYGRQTESFETVLPFGAEDGTVNIPAVFIRAPQIVRSAPGSRCSRRTRAGPCASARAKCWLPASTPS